MCEGNPAHRGLHVCGMCAHRVVLQVQGLCVTRESVNEDAQEREARMQQVLVGEGSHGCRRLHLKRAVHEWGPACRGPSYSSLFLQGKGGELKGRWKKPLGQGQGRGGSTPARLSAHSAGLALASRGATWTTTFPEIGSAERVNETRRTREGGGGRRCGARAGLGGGAAGLSPPPAPGPIASPARNQPSCASSWPHRRTMKALLLAVLAAVLCVERGKGGGGFPITQPSPPSHHLFFLRSPSPSPALGFGSNWRGGRCALRLAG